MSLDDLWHVVHATAADFNCILVENFLKFVASPKMFWYPLKECLCNVCRNGFAKVWVKVLNDNITRTYKKVPPKSKTSLNLEAKSIAELINLKDCIKCIAGTPAFIAFKDHELDYWKNQSCRLINLAKIELGKVSKLMIEKINKKLISELHLSHWKNTDSVLKLFIDISNKKDS